MAAPRIYLDHNADAPVHPAALQAYLEATESFGNPSSRHVAGSAAREVLERARATVAERLGAFADEIVFTSGGTEADALAVTGALAGSARPHVVSSRIEHAAVARTLDGLAAVQQIELTRVAAERHGAVEVTRVVEALRADTRLVSLVLACNETGVLQPVAEVAAACRVRGVLAHSDAVQAVGRVAVDAHALGIDLLTVSGHKLGAVGGIGALFVRRGVKLVPLVLGGGHEGGRRAGTENVAGAASLAAALALAPDAGGRAAWAAKRDRLEQGLRSLARVELIGGDRPRLCNTACLRFVGCEGDAVMMALDLDGVSVSTGSACSSGSVEPSPILLGMGLSPNEARETVRFSLGSAVGETELDAAIKATVRVVERIRTVQEK